VTHFVKLFTTNRAKKALSEDQAAKDLFSKSDLLLLYLELNTVKKVVKPLLQRIRQWAKPPLNLLTFNSSCDLNFPATTQRKSDLISAIIIAFDCMIEQAVGIAVSNCNFLKIAMAILEGHEDEAAYQYKVLPDRKLDRERQWLAAQCPEYLSTFNQKFWASLKDNFAT
jgi:hypothetical protein